MIWNEIVKRQTGILNFTNELNEAIAKTKIAVFGAGGNGAVLDVMLRTGYQHFSIVDFDVVEASNLNRLPFTPDYIGKPKVEAWQEYLAGINPACETHILNQQLTRNDEPVVRDIVQASDLVILNTSDFEANFVIARVAYQLGKRMIAGPGTANCWVVTTFTHQQGVSLESVGGFGTEHQDVKEVDYEAALPKYAKINLFPGRQERLYPEVLDQVRATQIAPRSCKMFVSLVNSAQTWEAVKNTAVLNGMDLRNTRVIEFPVLQMFDPFRGSSFFWNAETGQIGIPNWLTEDVVWYELDGNEA